MERAGAIGSGPTTSNKCVCCPSPGDHQETDAFLSMQSRCTDHRIHLSLSLPSVQDGPGLETLHDALAEDEEERQLEALWKSEMDTG